MMMEVTWNAITGLVARKFIFMRLGRVFRCILARVYTLVPTVRETVVKLVIAVISQSFPESKSIPEACNLTWYTILINMELLLHKLLCIMLQV